MANVLLERTEARLVLPPFRADAATGARPPAPWPEPDRMSVARVRDTLDALPVFALLLERDGRTGRLNRYAWNALGRPATSLSAVDVGALVATDGDGAAWHTAVATAMTADRPPTWESELETVDGRVRVAWRSSFLRDASGSVTGLVAVGEDITVRRAVERDRERLVLAVEQADDAVMITDRDAHIVYVNPAFEAMTGFPAADVLGTSPRRLSSSLHSDAFYRRMWRTLRRGEPWTGELVNRHADGSLYIEERSITPLRDDRGTITAYVGVGRDVTRRRALHTSLSASARVRDEVAHAVARLEAGADREQTAGRIAQTLTIIGEVEVACVLLHDESGMRVAGLAGLPDVTSLWRMGDRLDAERAGYLSERGGQGPWTEAWPSGGTVPQDPRVIAAGVTTTVHVPILDDGLLLGILVVGTTRSGDRSRFARHIPALLEIAAVARRLLAADPGADAVERLRREVSATITERAFRTVFQPIVDLESGAAVGFEALTRFDDSASQELRFTQARGLGLGTMLEVATARAALSAAHALPEGTWLSINVSPALALDTELLADLLEGRDRPVVLELTEHEPVDDYVGLRGSIERLGAGIRLAVDDAGAGAANLVGLVEARPDIVKMDMQLVRGIDTDVTRQAMAVGLLHFANATGRQIIAEGIQTEAERRMLRSLGVRLGQGYLFGRPVAAADLGDFPVFQPRPAVTPLPAPSPAPRLLQRRRATLLPRDLELITLLSDGLTLNQAAAAMAIAPGTAKNRRHEAYQKLGVRDLAGALQRVRELGLDLGAAVA